MNRLDLNKSLTRFMIKEASYPASLARLNLRDLQHIANISGKMPKKTSKNLLHRIERLALRRHAESEAYRMWFLLEKKSIMPELRQEHVCAFINSADMGFNFIDHCASLYWDMVGRVTELERVKKDVRLTKALQEKLESRPLEAVRVQDKALFVGVTKTYYKYFFTPQRLSWFLNQPVANENHVPGSMAVTWRDRFTERLLEVREQTEETIIKRYNRDNSFPGANNKLSRKFAPSPYDVAKLPVPLHLVSDFGGDDNYHVKLHAERERFILNLFAGQTLKDAATEATKEWDEAEQKRPQNLDD